MKKRHRNKAGHRPGAVVFTGQRKVEKIAITYIEYNEEHYTLQQLDNQQITQFHAPKPGCVQWYDVRGLHDTDLIEEFGRVFNIHALAAEDIADTDQRPKLDEYPEGIFVTIRAMIFDKALKKIQQEHISLYLGNGFVLSFQEDDSDTFLTVRSRICDARGRIRRRGADYLLYALLDAIVDNYYILLDDLEENIENLEEALVRNPSPENKMAIHRFKQEMMLLRRHVSPLRECLIQAEHLEFGHFTESTLIFMRDLRDHVFQVTELTEAYRDMLNSLQDLYLAELSFRMNNIMKILTVVSTIFIPLSFFAGVYGMNFHYMPELEWRYSYPVFWAFIVLLTTGMLWYFKRKRWM